MQGARTLCAELRPSPRSSCAILPTSPKKMTASGAFIHQFRDVMPAKKQKWPQSSAPGSRTKPANSVRIIGGLWRGSKIPLTERTGLRPSASRTRETLFNWLQPYISQSRVLDLFAGSGALGVEALSRGASHIYFVEPHRETLNLIEKTVERLQLGSRAAGDASFHEQDAVRFLQSHRLPAVDTVLLDPPFDDAQGLIQAIAPSLCQGLQPLHVFLESPIEEYALLNGYFSSAYTAIKQKRIGKSSITLLARHDEET